MDVNDANGAPFAVVQTGAGALNGTATAAELAALNAADGTSTAASLNVSHGTGGTCATSLAPGSSCLIGVRFAPVGAGTFPETFTLNYNDGVGAVFVPRPMTGDGALPASLTISDGPTYDYQIQATGSITDYTFTITNGGAVSAIAMADAGGLALPFTFTGAGYPGANGTCGVSLASLATCDIEVAYEPTGVGTQNDTIDIQYNDGVVLQNDRK